MTVLVTGVRGGVGRLVAAGLVAGGEDVRATSGAGLAPAGLDVPTVRVDLRTGEGLAAALDGVDRVFLYAAADGIGAVAAALAAAGVQQVVVLSSASVEMPEISGYIGRMHAAVEAGINATGMGHTFLRPNAFATNTLAWAEMVRAGAVALPFPEAYTEPIHEADIADAAVAALTDAGHRGHAYYLTGGVSMTQRAQVGVIAGVLGREIAVTGQPVAQWRQQLLDRGTPSEIADTLQQIWEATADEPGRTDGTITDVTGAAPRSYAQWVADHRAEFT